MTEESIFMNQALRRNKLTNRNYNFELI